MELVLIACSKKKSPGGIANYPTSNLKELIPQKTFHRLMNLRKEIANIKCFSEGPDLREGSLPVNTLYKPAYSRYTGIVYQQSGFEAIFPQIKGKMVLIVSALYGILEAEDYVRDYDLRMDESLLNGGHVSTWWRNHHLGSILEECILSIKPDTVHDLLPKVYRSALEPLPLKGLEVKGIRYEMYEYPGLGTGSQWQRGNDLKNLLITR